MDFSYLISISEGDKKFTGQFISTFEANSRKLLAAMKTALAANDYDSLKKSVHQLKPSLEMLNLETHSLALRIQENPADTTMQDVRKIEEECVMAVREMNLQFT